MESDETTGSQSLDREGERNLQELYPRQKSYDELLHKRQKAIELRLSQRPKYTLVVSIFILGGILALLLNAASIILIMLMFGGGAMGGIFFSFFLGLILFGLAIWQFKNIGAYFYDRGLSGALYSFVYILTAFIVAAIYKTLFEEGSILLSIVLCLIHSAGMVTYGLIYIKRKGR